MEFEDNECETTEIRYEIKEDFNKEIFNRESILLSHLSNKEILPQ
jgi:hypothetical protein